MCWKTFVRRFEDSIQSMCSGEMREASGLRHSSGASPAPLKLRLSHSSLALMRDTKVLRKLFHCPIIAVSILLAGCSSHKPSVPLAAQDPEPFVRIENTDSNLIQLQIAVREFVPFRGRGPTIWLTGVSHIGDSNYYAALQQHLDAQTLVLFEGISASSDRAADMTVRKASRAKDTANSTKNSASDDVGGLQSSLAASLGLVFQLTAIDYQRSNFRNCDLSIPELRQLLAQGEATSGASGAGESFEGVLQLLQGGSFFDSVLQVGLRFLGASPKLRALGRLALIDVIGEIQGDFSHLHGMPPEMQQLLEVLLERRNQKVVSELKTELNLLGQQDNLAVFYGTGHMPDLEKRLRQQLNYRPVAEHWFTAFSVDLVKAGVSESERQTVRNLIKLQLAQFQPK
jgi:hypothetical protein